MALAHRIAYATFAVLRKLDFPVLFCFAGKDSTAETLEKCARDAGVNVQYQYNAEKPTGKCAVLITGQNRSLVTKLDAANCFTVDHLEPNWAVVERAQAVYRCVLNFVAIFLRMRNTYL